MRQTCINLIHCNITNLLINNTKQTQTGDNFKENPSKVSQCGVVLLLEGFILKKKILIWLFNYFKGDV